MSTISTAFEKDKEVFFLIDLELDGWHKRLTNCRGGLSVSYSGNDSLLFEDLILNSIEVVNSFNLSSRRCPSTKCRVVMNNNGRFQDYEKFMYIHEINGTIWAWSKSLDFSDVEDYPLFQGTFRKISHMKDRYTFEILDFASTKGKWVDNLTISGNPAAIVKYLLDSQTLLDADQIDHGSLADLEDFLTGFSFSTTIDEGADIFDVIDRILAEVSAVRINKNGKIAVDSFDKFGESGHRIVMEDLASNPIIELSPFDLVTNRVKIHYNPSGGSYSGNFTRDWTNNRECKLSYITYEEQPERTFQCPDCATQAQAENCLSRFLDWNAMRHDIITVAVPYHIGFDIQQGDIADLTIDEGSGGGWVDEKCLLLDRTFTQSAVKQRWWRINTN